MMALGFNNMLGDVTWGLAMLIMMLIPVVILVGAVYLGYRLWERGHKKDSYEMPAQEPLEVIKRRYARGEITREQYGQMKDDLLLK